MFNLVFLKHYTIQLTHFGESLPTWKSPLAIPTSMSYASFISWPDSKVNLIQLYKLVTLNIPGLLFL